ncbi:protocadherin Fat 4-like [Gigantopelta aegis]|uniref:protocadherin Fat 4-like n=1 Tax=Gigantopelta aegis TaxID=1735272 RepID=UPI001B88A6DE|nr:protocadherin Fat 4-like [Gigantopelta aegis]
MNAGREADFETDGKMSVQLVNDQGIPITAEGKVYLQIKGCGNAFFILTKSAKFSDKGGTYFVVLLGSGNNGKINGIKESCFSCKQLKATKYEKLLDCNRFNKFWVTWNDKGNIKFGRGMDITGAPLLDYTGSTPFRINYLNLLSSKYKVKWKVISDNPPVFVYPSAFGNKVIEVPENATVDTTLLTVNATDPEGDEVTYSIDGDYSDIFECYDDKVNLIGKLDFETKSHYIVEITATDSLNDVKLAITIQVTDVNDETPEVEIKAGISISEELPVGTSIGGLISGTDKDRGDTLMFRLEGNDSRYFLNVTSEGNVITNDRLDRDGKSGRVMLDALSVTVIDAANHEKKAAINITVTDVNDNAPQFEHNVYKVNITENQANNLTILKLICSDADLGSNAEFKISLSNTMNGLFRLDNDSLFVDGETVDLESMDESVIILPVIAVDLPDTGPSLTGSAQILVKVLPQNDYDPTWSSPTTDNNGSFPNITIARSTSPNVIISTFKAEDRDTGVRSNITYSILAIRTDFGENAINKFSIDPTTGVLTLSSPISLNESLFDVTIQASDGDEPARTVAGNLTLNVQRSNQHKPRFNQSLYEVQVKEDSDVNTVIHTALADDRDGDNVTYDVTGTWNFVFQVEGDKVKILKKLDYENRRTYPVTLRASDGEKEDTSILLVSVVDVIDEPPLITTPGRIEVPRDVPVQTVLGGVFTVTDKDEGDEFTYKLTGNDSDFFQLNRTDGQLQVIKRFDSGVSDDRKFLDSLTLTVSDKSGTNTSKSLNITLLEPHDDSRSQPQLLRSGGYSVDVAENTTMGSVLYNLTLEVDVDDPATVVFTVIDGGNETFSFNESLLILSREVDFETQSVHVLTISVKSGKHSTSGSMVLYITDVNDEVPVISLEENLTLAEEIPIGTHIAGLFQVVDSDKGDNLTYSLTGNHSQYFDVNPTNGQLRIRERINRDGAAGIRVLEEITLNVVDVAGHVANKTFNITITDVNDNPPSCGDILHIANVTENSTNEIVVTSLSCTDVDEDTNNITVTIIDGNESVFKMNGSDVVADGQKIDYDTATNDDTSYVLTLHVVDGAINGFSNTATVIVRVQVLPRNEHDPTWTSNTTLNGVLQNQTTASNIARDSSILTLAASDDDAGPDGTIIYQLISTISDAGTEEPGLFRVDPTSGYVTNTDFLDSRSSRNISTYYDVTVMATDMGQQPRNITSTVRVSVQPVMWKSVFNATATTMVEVQLPEDTSVGAVVHTFDDIDADVYQLFVVGRLNETFQFNQNRLTLKGKLDYETQTVHVVNSRVFNAITTSYVTVVVTVNDVIDEPPVIELSSELKLAEELPVGSTVAGLFTVKDNDKNDTLNYTLSGQHAKYFTINQNTGELSVTIPVDRDGDTGVAILDDLWLTVEDKSGLQANTSLNITVVDVNDNSPVCGSDIVNVNVTENSASGLKILNLTCTDADAGPNANITLRVVNGTTTPSFAIEESSLVTVNSLDYEKPGISDNKYTVLVLATDHPINGQSNTGTTVIQIEILSENEFEPVWQIPNVTASLTNTTELTTSSSINSSTQSPTQNTQPGTVTFPAVTLNQKAVAGTIVTRVVAEDKDKGPDGQLNYEVVSVLSDTNESKSSMFKIDSRLGIITLAEKPTDQANVSSYYDITVSVRDNGNPSKSSRALIKVTIQQILNSPPSFNESLSTISIPEDTAVGDAIFNITVWDGDGDNVTVHIKGKAASLFLVNGSMITLMKQLDFEKEAFHLCILSATDGKSTTESSLLVRVTNVMDEPPVIRVGEQTTLMEGLPPGLIISGLFTVTDADEGDTLNYTLRGTHSSFFSIDNVTGEVKIREYLDYDGSNGLRHLDDLILVVEDSAQMTANVSLNLTLLDVNDNSPTFSQSIYYANITENSNASMLVLELDCTDIDEGPNGNVTLNITNGDSESVYRLEGRQLFADASRIDLEGFNQTCPVFVLTILASDSSENTNTATAVVIVKILPKNEFVPKWQMRNGEADINETVDAYATVGSPVTVFYASDEDTGDDGIVNYFLTSSQNGSNHSDVFKLDKVTGVLVTTASLSQRSGETYNLTIEARDNGSPPKYTDTKIMIKVEPVQNRPPEFPLPIMSTTVSEDAAMGSVVYNLSVTDPEGNNVTVELLGNDTDNFIVDGYQIKVNGKLDYEKETIYVIAVRASDNKQHSSAVVRVNIRDVIDEYPELEASKTVVVPEELPIGTVIGSFATVVDRDKGDNLTLSLHGEGSEFFSVNPISGEMSINRTMDYDEERPFRNGALTLQAVDSEGLQSNVSVNISITNINDNPPVFQQNTYLVSVQENTTRDSPLIQLNVTDKDAGDSDNLTLTFALGNEKGYFRLVNQSLYVQGESLDYEQKSSFTLIAIARDQPTTGSSLTGTTVITVKITSKNEFAPVWSGVAPAGADVSSNQAIINANASSVNSKNTTENQNSTKPETNTTLLLLYNEQTGLLSVNDYVNSDAPFTIYRIMIAATDGGTPSRQTNGSVTVIVERSAVDLSFNQSLYRLTIPENTSVGEVLYSLALRSGDIDPSNVSFQIVDANISSSRFQMNNNKFILSKSLDFEDTNQYLIRVRATYGEDESYAWLMVKVSDVIDERPEITLSGQLAIPEELPVGSVVNNLFTVVDKDIEDNLTYSLTDISFV